MKKILKAIGSLIKGILGNLDYLAAFVVGALAYKFAPEQLESIAMAIKTFDYASAFEVVKNGAISAYNAVEGFIKGLLADKAAA